MTHINEDYGAAANRYRIGEAFVDLNFGLVEIGWDTGFVALSTVGKNGKIAFRQEVKFATALENGAK